MHESPGEFPPTQGAAVNERIPRWARAITEDDTISWESLFGLTRQRQAALKEELDTIIREEKRISAAQEQAARVAELERCKGYQRYSAKVHPTAKLEAVQTANGDIATDPTVVRNTVRASWGELLGIRS
jgi:hypothetical protein